MTARRRRYLSQRPASAFDVWIRFCQRRREEEALEKPRAMQEGEQEGLQAQKADEDPHTKG
jgi:hypothetical protein